MQFLGIPRSKSTIFFCSSQCFLINYRKILDHTKHFRAILADFASLFFVKMRLSNAFVPVRITSQKQEWMGRMNCVNVHRLKIFSLLIFRVNAVFSFFSNLHSFCKYLVSSSCCVNSCKHKWKYRSFITHTLLFNKVGKQYVKVSKVLEFLGAGVLIHIC